MEIPTDRQNISTSLTSTLPTMQTMGRSNGVSFNTTIHLSEEHRARLYSVIHQFSDEQLRIFIRQQLQLISSTNTNISWQMIPRVELISNAFYLINSHYSIDMEHNMYAVLHNRYPSDYRPPQSQQQQQTPQIHQQAPLPTQQNYAPAAPFNRNHYYYPQQTIHFSHLQNIRSTQSQSNVAPQLRPMHVNMNVTQINHGTNQSSSSTVPSGQPITFFTPAVARQPVPVQSTNPANILNNPLTPSSSGQVPRYSMPNITGSSTNIAGPPVQTSINNKKITHTTSPFHRTLVCLLESHSAFRYDSYRKQHVARHEFLLPVEVCNQLALSFDYDPDLDMHKTEKCLILRLVRIDQPPISDGKYADHLPPNLAVTINRQNVTNLPTPKPCSRNQTDLIRPGRPIDITPYCMFNPMLANELVMSWFYRPENTSLLAQYANAQFALHIFLVEQLTIDNLYEQITEKPTKFLREDLARLIARVQATDRELGLEVSDLILKLKCPIDQRRLRTPVRAVTCQHLQCFDLKNYIVMNQQAGKWICPVCNKLALFDDLQIDSYTESILNSVENENIIEISIDSNLQWRSTASISSITGSIEPKNQRQTAHRLGDIVLGDDHDQGQWQMQIDSKYHIPLIKAQPQQAGEFILIDED